MIRVYSFLLLCYSIEFTISFSCISRLKNNPTRNVNIFAAKGFGSSSSSSSNSSKRKKINNNKLIDTLQDKPSQKASNRKPFVKSEQEQLIASLTSAAAQSCLGKAIAESHSSHPPDPFWELIPTLILSKFPNTSDEQFTRIAGFLKHAVHPDLPIIKEEDDVVFRPLDEIHAYMPGLGPTQPFYDTQQLPLCQQLTEHYDTILQEYQALVEYNNNNTSDLFQSVTSMNYQSGWKTLVLFYNGHRIPNFPYHLCPTTTRILETVPLAGRIAGFNRQQPQTGIPKHTDGNNMWLTCQMGVVVPENDAAWIRVGPETRRWKAGQCLLYDTTYEHETFNEHETQERVVLHVDFFNTLAMTPLEIQVLQYIYSLREEFMKAEGVAKVGAQIL